MIILYSFVSSTTAIYTLSLHDALPISYRILRRLGLEDITIDYLIVDPLRVDRETFKAIWTAWRDGFADTVAAHTSVTREQFLAHFADMIATLDDPDGYGVWHVPVIAGRVGPG